MWQWPELNYLLYNTPLEYADLVLNGGIGTNALRAFMNYCFDSGVDELYTQTWSGNVRMIRCAERLGFVECNREINFREVNGQKYDGLTFRVERI